MRTLVDIDNPELGLSHDDLNTRAARFAMSSESDPKAFWTALDDPSFYRFSFVRNPYTRSLSCYLDKIVKNRLPKFVGDLGFDRQEKISFEQFLERVGQQNTKVMNRHWRPQSCLIPATPKIDFLGRFETFSADFQNVLNCLNFTEIKVKTRANHATGVGNDLSNQISEKAISLINQIYRSDFERFSYKMIS